MNSVEFRVRPVTRHIVTRYEKSDSGAANMPIGEFDNETLASNAVSAFGDAESILAQPPNKIITCRPNTPPGHEQVRTWRRGEGWDDAPTTEGLTTDCGVLIQGTKESLSMDLSRRVEAGEIVGLNIQATDINGNDLVFEQVAVGDVA